MPQDECGRLEAGYLRYSADQGRRGLLMHVETDRIKRRVETRLVKDNQATGSNNLTHAFAY